MVGIVMAMKITLDLSIFNDPLLQIRLHLSFTESYHAWRYPKRMFSLSQENFLIPIYGVLSLYATAVIILFLRAQRNVWSLDFVRKFKRDIPEENFVELELWLPQLACNEVESMWIDIDLTDDKLFLNKQSTNQPRGHAQKDYEYTAF